MATYYFDALAGDDANAGTDIAAPKRTYDAFSTGGTAAGDRFLFKCGAGQDQLITTVNKSLIGGSAASPVYYGVYGDRSQPRPRFITTNTATGIFNQSRRSHYVVEDLHFDMRGAEINSLYISATSLGAVTNVRIRRCLFENAGGDYAGLYIGRENSTYQTDDVIVEDCEFRNNGADGITVLACNNVRVINCVGFDNGAEGPNGGHNFRMTSRKVTVTSGWTLSSGTIYYRALAAYETDVHFVATPTYPRMTKTAGTAPTAGQFSVSGGNFYINNNANPSGVSITYVWDACYGVVFERCKSFRSLWNREAPFQEGHAFSFDDYVSDCAMIACEGYDSEGLGISINNGDRNLIIGCYLHGNAMRAISIGSGINNVVRNCTIVDNNQGEGAGHNEIAVGGTTATGTEVSNCLIISDVATGVDFSSATGCTATNNWIFGPSTAVVGGTETSTTSTDPTAYLSDTHRPRVQPSTTAATLATDNPLAVAGTYIAGVRLRNGRMRPGACPAGAHQAVIPNTAS